MKIKANGKPILPQHHREPVVVQPPGEEDMVSEQKRCDVPESWVGDDVYVSLRYFVAQRENAGFPGVRGKLESVGPYSVTIRTSDATILGPPGVVNISASDYLAVNKYSAIETPTKNIVGLHS